MNHPSSRPAEKGLISQKWLDQGSSLSPYFEAALPFPHLVLDDFLDSTLAEELLAEFPDEGSMFPTRDYLFGKKFEMPEISKFGEAASRFKQLILGEEFSRFLNAITGFDVFIDPELLGGGFHQGGTGSYLDLHVDFNLHPNHQNWLRTLNILIYMNKDWQSHYGGQLLIASSPREVPTLIDPCFNRAVIMLSGDSTYHGYHRMSLPVGVTRKLLAVYAYQKIEENQAPAARSTHWFPKSGQVWRRALAKIYNRVEGTTLARRLGRR
jgi:hypothetical protein